MAINLGIDAVRHKRSSDAKRSLFNLPAPYLIEHCRRGRAVKRPSVALPGARSS